eukprot:gene13675-biopygen11089
MWCCSFFGVEWVGVRGLGRGGMAGRVPRPGLCHAMDISLVEKSRFRQPDAQNCAKTVVGKLDYSLILSVSFVRPERARARRSASRLERRKHRGTLPPAWGKVKGNDPLPPPPCTRPTARGKECGLSAPPCVAHNAMCPSNHCHSLYFLPPGIRGACAAARDLPTGSPESLGRGFAGAGQSPSIWRAGHGPAPLWDDRSPTIPKSRWAAPRDLYPRGGELNIPSSGAWPVSKGMTQSEQSAGPAEPKGDG